ncbi:hypothetical protein D3C85_1853880 [compost metagenome]
MEAHLAHDIEYLLTRFEAGDYVSSSDPDCKYLKDIQRDPGAIEDIARQRAFDGIWVCRFNDDDGEENKESEV